MTDALLIAGGVGVASASAFAFRLLTGREREQLVLVELRFGSDLRREQVEALLAAASGLSPDVPVVLDVVATDNGIRHFLRSDQATVDTLSGQLRVLAPGTRVGPARAEPPPSWAYGARLVWAGGHVLLRADGAEETAAGLLAALGPLAAGETVLVRVALYPGRPRPLRAPQHAQDRAPSLFLGVGSVRQHELGALRSKYAAPVLHAEVLVAVASTHPGRAAHLIGRVSAVIRSRRGPRGHLQVKRLNGRAVERSLARRPRRGVLLSPAELSGPVGWPIGAPRLPGLQLGQAPLLYPDWRIPASGRVLAICNWPGMESRPLAQPVVGALSHTLIAGPTGSGKSALLTNLVLSDLEEGRGCLVLDGKGDLLSDLLERIPEKRLADVIVLDPAAAGQVPGLRVFGKHTDPELTADLVLGVLADIFRDSWGVRSAQWLRVGLTTIAHDPDGTLGDLPFVFTDERYRRRLVGLLTDPMLLASWAAFEAMSPGEKANQLGAPLTKLSELLGRRVLRTVLSQQHPRLDLHEALSQGRIVLVKVNPGQLGGPASRLLGALVLHELFSAVQARAALPPGKRPPFNVYLDEPRVLADIPVPLDGLFERARGNGVGLTIAAQSIAQLPTIVKQAALTNAATLLAFRQTADDAELLARQLPGVGADGLQALGAFELIGRIGLGPGDVSSPISGRTLPPTPPTSDPARVRHVSEERYGADRAEVDRALAERHGNSAGGRSADNAPVGRKRRTP